MAHRLRAWLPISLLLSPWSPWPSCQANRLTEDPADLLSPPPRPDASFVGCATAQYDAQQAQAAMLVVLDRSSSMARNNKWSFAAQAVVNALDQKIFDTMAVGLLAAPSGSVEGPECIFNFPVSCEAPAFPQIDLKLAGSQKSGDPTGVRHDIKTWLTQNSADKGLGDATPLYGAMQLAIETLKAWPQVGKRLMFVVTDGTLSCNQFSTRPGFKDCNGCDHDWEHPQNLIDLLKTANEDKSKPIDTFVVGVPGADTYDARGCAAPPYHMRLALSAIAYAGSPNNVPTTCTGKAFTQAGGDPTVSCHFDMTQGNFNAQALADSITLIRGKVLSCTFDLPQPPQGTLNRFQVNVEYSTDAGKNQLFKRKDSTNPCLDKGCWDYTKDDKVEILGKACEELKAKPEVKVKIVVGCDTVIG